jgi:hypothetical protein
MIPFPLGPAGPTRAAYLSSSLNPSARPAAATSARSPGRLRTPALLHVARPSPLPFEPSLPLTRGPSAPLLCSSLIPSAQPWRLRRGPGADATSTRGLAPAPPRRLARMVRGAARSAQRSRRARGRWPVPAVVHLRWLFPCSQPLTHSAQPVLPDARSVVRRRAGNAPYQIHLT